MTDRNISMTTSDSYEIMIGDTVYVISHEYGTADLSDLILDYLSAKVENTIKKAA